MEMNTRLMAGQRLIFGFDGLEFNDDLKHIIKDLNTCGIILFKRNIQSPDQVKKLISDCRNYAAECGIPPLITCVDQEGGVVARFREPFTIFKGNPFIRSIEEAEQFARITADELGEVGINMNLAPVLDIAPDGFDSIMKDRVFPGDENMVAKLGEAVIKTLQANKMMAVAKHFPGIGRTTKDSHFHLPVLDIDLETLNSTELVPFKTAITAGVSGIMLSHIFYPQQDDTWQASLSPAIAKTLLRDSLGYEGLVFTDDLDMKAIKLDIESCVRQILLADIDIALICHKGPNIDKAWSEMVRLMEADRDLHNSGLRSVERILRYKKKWVQGG